MDGQVSIGETLRRRREERGLTAAEVALQSKVPLRLVHMIESGDYRLLPDPLYLVRLVHDYAMCLGVDVRAVDAEFERTMHQCLRVPAAATGAAPATTPVRRKRVLFAVAALLLTAPLLAIALSLAVQRRSGDGVPSRPSEVPPGRVTSARTEPVRATDSVTAPPTEPALAIAPSVPSVPDVPVTPVVGTHLPQPMSVTTTPSPAASPGHILIVRAQELTWLAVRADRKAPREVMLRSGETVRFEAETDFHIVVGNAGGVTLSLDGTPLPPLGRSGEVVRDLVLPASRRDSSPSDTVPPSSTR